ncbi:MAG: hypothetical protein M1818_002074 [Claussenomyces sp. TS43310]|nr:MAG: hypothetical protein M1818_002074 [Claussenomyces sp. TS43310]
MDNPSITQDLRALSTTLWDDEKLHTNISTVFKLVNLERHSGVIAMQSSSERDESIRRMECPLSLFWLAHYEPLYWGKTAYNPVSLMRFGDGDARLSENMPLFVKATNLVTCCSLLLSEEMQLKIGPALDPQDEKLGMGSVVLEMQEFLDLFQHLNSRRQSLHFQGWLDSLLALCALSITKSITIDLHAIRSQYSPSLDWGFLDANRIDSAYKSLVSIFTWCSKSDPIAEIDGSTISPKLRKILQVVDHDCWRERGIESTKDYLMRLGTEILPNGAYHGFFVQRYKVEDLSGGAAERIEQSYRTDHGFVSTTPSADSLMKDDTMLPSRSHPSESASAVPEIGLRRLSHSEASTIAFVKSRETFDPDPGDDPRSHHQANRSEDSSDRDAIVHASSREGSLAIGERLSTFPSGDGSLPLKPTRRRKAYSEAQRARCDPSHHAGYEHYLSSTTLDHQVSKAAVEVKSWAGSSAPPDAYGPSSSFRSDHQYQPLTSDEIRIVKILPGKKEDAIECIFEHISISHSPDYEALSYTWGSLPPTCDILVQAQSSQKVFGLHVPPKTLSIRSQLFEALKALRHQDSTRALWVDALCIDQNNTAEKNSQISRMCDIYTKASGVIIWLGVGDPSSDLALDFIPQILDLAHVDDLINDASSRNGWAAFSALVENPYWCRIWTLQNLVQARKATLKYGQRQIEFEDFADALAIFHQKYLHGKRALAQGINQVGDMAAWSLISTISNGFRKSDDGLIIERRYTLETLVASLSALGKTDPRDTIYAFLGLANNTTSLLEFSFLDKRVGLDKQEVVITPDYSKDFLEIGTEFVISTIEYSKSLDIICRHWAPKASANHDLTPKKLPSWISSISNSAFGDQTLSFAGRRNGDSLVGLPDRVAYNASGGRLCSVRFGTKQDSQGAMMSDGSLTAQGFGLDSIQEVTPRATHGIIFQEALLLGGWYMSGDELPDEVPERLWRTAVGDRGPNLTNAPTWYRRAFRQCLSYADANGDLYTSKILSNIDNSSIIAEFLEKVQSIVWNRRFIKTAKGFFGLVPPAATSSDLICILFGCSVPVVLRKHEDCFTLIGECYIHGMMDGEAMKLLQSGEVTAEELKLV